MVDTLTASNRKTHLLVAVLLFSAAWRVVAINRVFSFDVEATSSAYGVFARNYLQYGLVQTGAIPVITVGEPAAGTPVVYYPNHPPLVALLIAGVYAVLGVGQWQTRLPTSIATVLAVYCLYRLVRIDSSERAALFAAAFFAAMPMNLYFGGFPEVVDMPLILFAVLAVAAYLFISQSAWTLGGHKTVRGVFGRRTKRLARFHSRPCLLSAFSCDTAINCLALVYRILLGCVGALRLPLHLHRRGGRSELELDGDVTAGTNRVRNGGDVFWREWLHVATQFNRDVHTFPMLMASATWLAITLVRPGFAGRGGVPARILLAWGVLHVLIGREGVFVHPWWWSPLTPGLAVSAALLTDGTVRAFERKTSGRFGGVFSAFAAIVFAVWTSTMTARKLFPREEQLPFTMPQLGNAIRLAAPNPSDLALLVWSNSEPPLWFYGNRALRANVWSIAELKSAKRTTRRTYCMAVSSDGMEQQRALCFR